MAPKIRKKRKLNVDEGQSSAQAPRVPRKLSSTEQHRRQLPSTEQHPRQLSSTEQHQLQDEEEEYSMNFRSIMQQRKYDDDFSNRSIILSKTVHFQTFASLGIQEMCERIGLLGLCQQLSNRCCERTIRLFYVNMYTGAKTESLKTYIFGTELLITPAMVNAIIGFPFQDDAGVIYYHGSREPNFIKGREGLEFLRMIHTNANIEAFEKPMSKDLNVKARAIHNMISHTILPRDGHRDLVTYMDLYVMEKLYTGCRFNPGYMILSHMKDISRTSNKSLGYNTLIQKLLDHFNVSIPADESLRSKRPSDVFDRLHLRRMGIVEVDNNWIFKPKKRVTTRLSDDAASPNVELSSSDITMQKLDMLINNVKELTTRQIALDDKVEELIISNRELSKGQRELRLNYTYLSARVFNWIKEHNGEAAAEASTKAVDDEEAANEAANATVTPSAHAPPTKD